MKKLIPGQFFLCGTAAQKMDRIEAMYGDQADEVMRTDPGFRAWTEAFSREEVLAAVAAMNGQATCEQQDTEAVDDTTIPEPDSDGQQLSTPVTVIER